MHLFFFSLTLQHYGKYLGVSTGGVACVYVQNQCPYFLEISFYAFLKSRQHCIVHILVVTVFTVL